MATEEENHEKKFAPRVTFGSFTLATDPQGSPAHLSGNTKRTRGGSLQKQTNGTAESAVRALRKIYAPLKSYMTLMYFRTRGHAPRSGPERLPAIQAVHPLVVQIVTQSPAVLARQTAPHLKIAGPISNALRKDQVSQSLKNLKNQNQNIKSMLTKRNLANRA